MIVDAKSLFDALCSDQCYGDDERSALEIAIVKESLSIVGGRLRWIPHNLNVGDALAKLEGERAGPLIQLQKTSSMRIEQEAEVLQRGKQSERRMKTSFGGLEFWGLS